MILKEGNIKVKHLCHKSNSKCNGTGESIYHKMWKEHLFYRGAQILVNGLYYEIYNIHNEKSLRDFFSMNWDIDIIPDIILETNGGYVIVEIYYSHKKDWIAQEKYYETIKDHILKVFEVKVNMAVNENIVWRTKDEIIAEINVKIENKRIKEEKLAKKRYIEVNKINKYKCYFNSLYKIHKIKDNLYGVPCFISNESYIRFGTGNQALLIFDTGKQYISEDRIKRNFNIPYKHGESRYSTFEVNGDVLESPYLIVNTFYDVKYTIEEQCLVSRILSASNNVNKMIGKYISNT